MKREEVLVIFVKKSFNNRMFQNDPVCMTELKSEFIHDGYSIKGIEKLISQYQRIALVQIINLDLNVEVIQQRTFRFFIFRSIKKCLLQVKACLVDGSFHVKYYNIIVNKLYQRLYQNNIRAGFTLA